jgi:hypothetical protein
VEGYRCVPGTVTTVSLILSCSRVLVLDGEMGVLRGELGGGICGFEARSRASLKVDDIVANACKRAEEERSTVPGRTGNNEVSSPISLGLCIVDTRSQMKPLRLSARNAAQLWNWNVSDALPVFEQPVLCTERCNC